MQGHKVCAAKACAMIVLAIGMSGGTVQAMAAKHPAKPAAKAAAPAHPRAEAVVVTVQPPSGQWEPKPPAAQGWVWSSGYYEWKDGRFEWKKGEWVQDREGMDYRQHEWVAAGPGKWKLVGGDWVAENHASAAK
ncbi:MAG TPA: hypothetical protein VHA82_00405 [Ramlibacter sp.]|uniref:hypothetical protein n=1 Tax=Ramlibacter sp. TaxID=1917967 RepID=UPI002C44EED5|nr:hypothetical protein [Ramlibacter sp.]HVZ42240.1 hypothetical protein [Ramlibacter sp.]